MKRSHKEYFVGVVPGEVDAKELSTIIKLRALTFILFLIVYYFPF